MLRMIRGAVLGAAVGAVLCVAGGCVDRPVVARNPITNTNFTTSIDQTTIDKVDLLFDIDNSASMGDKEAYLAQAIPDLISRLVTPNCVDSAGKATGAKSDITGNGCAGDSNPEFAPVHNLHIGIVSSSLGARLGVDDHGNPTCPSTGTGSTRPLANSQMIDRHNDDQAHLLDRSSDPAMLSDYTETPLADADPTRFLDWFPTSNPNNANVLAAPPPASGPTAIQDSTVLQTDFQHLVVGVHAFGCGIESQLETWYRFLIQPDPYADLKTAVVDKQTIAQWDGVDTTILQQRADFLRPDSLVAILVLTDENDSEVDVRSFNGTAWNFMSRTFPPPRGTSVCLTNPADPGCTSCGFPGHSNDPECVKGNHTDPLDWGMDLNLRHVHEKQKYGVSVQFPIERYLVGLTSPKVPNRDGEYPPNENGSYASSYQGLNAGNLNCTNPLFAKTLPRAPNGDVANWKPQWTSGKPPSDPNNDLCNLPAGSRLPKHVFYAHIGGVPHQLLQTDPTNADSPQKDSLTAADWQLILGQDPENFNYSGIDPHMVESYQDRSSTPIPPTGHKVADPTQLAGTDPISGREWVTNSANPEHPGLVVDREYACIFKLTDPAGKPAPRQCDTAATTADPTLTDSCDCQPPSAGTFTHEEVPAVCNDAKPTQQDYAKAYPTIRELLLAKLMGTQGVISSLCPIHTFETTPGDPLYGYRPAMNAIVNVLKTGLGTTCLPQQLTIDKTTNKVQCLVLGTFPAGANAPMSCASVPGGGWTNPDSDILMRFKTDQHAAWAASNNAAVPDPAKALTCELMQLTPNVNCSLKSTAGSSDGGSSDGWCYVESASGDCAQEILFSPNARTANVVTSLQCLEQQPPVLQ